MELLKKIKSFKDSGYYDPLIQILTDDSKNILMRLISNAHEMDHPSIVADIAKIGRNEYILNEIIDADKRLAMLERNQNEIEEHI